MSIEFNLFLFDCIHSCLFWQICFWTSSSTMTILLGQPKQFSNFFFTIHPKNVQFLKTASFSSWTMINSDQRHVSSHLVVQSYHKLDVFATLLHHFIVACFCNKVFVTFSRYRCHHQCQIVTWSVSVVRRFWWFKEFENWNFGFGTGHICV